VHLIAGFHQDAYHLTGHWRRQALRSHAVGASDTAGPASEASTLRHFDAMPVDEHVERAAAILRNDDGIDAAESAAIEVAHDQRPPVAADPHGLDELLAAVENHAVAGCLTLEFDRSLAFADFELECHRLASVRA
jgi:hypothetical protein